MKAFDEYTSKFDKNNKITILKYNHSHRVMDLSNMLANKLSLGEEDIVLATTIGLIHDIGRFEQIKNYNTLKDIGTMDHGDFGAYLLFDENVISCFPVKKEDYNIVKTCVSKHNKYKIENCDNERELTHLKIIRDADKIDIFNIWANLDEMEIKSDGEISFEVVSDFFDGQMVHNENKLTNADNVVGTLSYIYDINYAETFEYIDSQNFINNLYERLEEKEKFKILFDEANKYIREHKKGDKKHVRKKIQSFNRRRR